MSKTTGSTRSGATNIPELLRGLNRWIGWELRKVKGKLRKVPVHPNGDQFSTSRDTPYSLERILACGLSPGFVLTDGVEVDGQWLVAFDLDACRDPEIGALTDWATEFLNRHQSSYTEITPSGTGLRLWCLVDEKPEGELAKVKALEAAPNTGEKKPEIETFGLGRACYVTVSGNPLPTSSMVIQGVRSLEWFIKRYPLRERKVDVELPVGEGKTPELATIEKRVLAHPEGVHLVAGRWEEVVPEESASEGYWRLVQRVVRAASGHGQAAIDFLLYHTAYGAGTVDSAEPDRYSREHWVAAEVARVASKAPRPSASAFSDDYVESQHMPEEGFTAPKEQEEPKRVKILQAGEFLKKVGSREWLVRDLFPSDGLAQIFGEPGAGKTPVALHLAISCALERPTWFGWEIDKPGPVVYIIGEDEAGIRDRLEGQLKTLLDPLDNVDEIPLYFTLEPAQITDAANVEAWIKAILQATGGAMPRLVVVDTMSRNFGTGNENSSEDMQAYVDGCGRLSARLGKALVLGVHHTGHADKDRGRGSTVLNGALDTNILVKAVGKYKIILEPKKVKGAAKPDPFPGTLVVANLGRDEKGRKITAITLEDRAPEPGEVFASVAADEETKAFLRVVKDLDGARVSQAELAEEAGVSRQEIRTILGRALNDLGLVAKSKEASARSKSSYTLTVEGNKSLEMASNQGPDISGAINQGNGATKNNQGPQK